MVTKLVDGLHGAIGSRFMPVRNQLAFVEWNTGAISLLDMIAPVAATVSSGVTVLKGTWVFDCETGALGGSLGGPGDIWWEQIDTVKRQMTPAGGARIVNLGHVPFASVTPAVLQSLTYGTTPIPGNNDPSNQLTTGDVFAVRTAAGNYARIHVVHYDYDMKIEWATYKLASPYHVIGTGYTNPEDIAVSSDEKTAYVTERSGNLLRVHLVNANRAAADLLVSGLQAPHQIYLDEGHNQAYLVEFANPGRLIRVDLATCTPTTVLGGLNNAIGLLLSADGAYAYITEQSGGGRLTRYSLSGGPPLVLASGLTNPFFMAWLDPAQSAILVAERDPANRITIVETVPHPGSVRQLVTGTGFRPSSAAVVNPSTLLIAADTEIDRADILADIVPAGLFKGIGLVPWNLIDGAGKVDMTSQPAYPYQFPKGSPFGGTLSLQINHQLAYMSGIRFYRVLVDGSPRLDHWSDLELNTANGKYEIPAPANPVTIAGTPGYYAVRAPGHWYMNADLGLIMDSSSVANGLRGIAVQFCNAAGAVVQTQPLNVLIDNNPCTAVLGMPSVAGHTDLTQCGMLKFAAKTDEVKIEYTASHPNLFANYSFSIIRGPNGVYSTGGAVQLAPFTFTDNVGHMLGTCPAAAFAGYLYVAATAINGFGRCSQYDASSAVAFALTP